MGVQGACSNTDRLGWSQLTSFRRCIAYRHRLVRESYRLLTCQLMVLSFFFFQAEDGIRDVAVTGVQTCALPIYDKGVPRNRESRILPAFVSRVRMNLRISALAGWLAVAFLLRLPAPTRRGFFGVTSNCLLVSNDGSCFTGARLSLRLGLIVPPQADAERPSARAKCTTRAFALSTEPYIPISPYLHISMPQGQGLCGSAGSNDPCGRAGDEPGGGADGGGGGPKNAGRQDAKSWEKSSWGNISAR